MSKIINKFIREGRVYAVIEQDGKKLTMPLAIYTWLKGNPSFKGIPKGYVVHHLDLDPLNDDISNLALMYKHHHVAYHFKHKNCNVPIECNVSLSNHEMGFDYPTRMPRIYNRKYKKTDYWFITYKTLGNKKIFVYNINGIKFRSREEAEKAIDIIWPNNIWRSKPDARYHDSATMLQS